MPGLKERVLAARTEKGWSQATLAAEVTRAGFKIGQSGIGNIESGQTKSPKCIAALAAALGVNYTWLTSGRGEKVAREISEQRQLSVMRDIVPYRHRDAKAPALLLWKSFPGDSTVGGTFMLSRVRGRLIPRPPELIDRDKAFSFELVGRENEPAYFAGDRLDVDPDMDVEESRDYLFLELAEPADGVPSIVGRLVGITDRLWIIRQYAILGDRELSRSQWRVAWKIVGRHHRQ